jgi:hypothetical protein
MNGNATPNETYAVGGTVALSNFDNTGVVSWVWTLLSKPAGSTAVLATPTAATSSFTADKEGSYRIRLVTNDGTSLAVARVKTTHVGLIPFAKDETNEGDSTEGWAKAWRESYQLLDQRIGIPANRRTVRYVGTAASGPLVLTATGAVVTLPNGDSVPAVDRVSAGAGSSAVFLWDGGALATNQDIRVLAWGMSDLFANPDTMVANSPVYLGTTGVLVKTLPSADAAQLVGFCLLVNGGNIRVWFEPIPRQNASTLPGAVVIDAASSNGTSRQVAMADHTHRLNTSASAPAAVDGAAAAAGTSGNVSRADHKHSVTTGVAASIVPDSANSAGSGSPLALANHGHALATYASVPPPVTSGGSAGTVGTVARGDHTHDHGAQIGGGSHAVAAVTAAGEGFMSVADKDKLAESYDVNLLLNGGFNWWQRGSTFTMGNTQAVAAYYDSTHTLGPYGADRWYFQSEKTAAGAQTWSSILSYQSSASPASSAGCIRIRNNTLNANNIRYQAVQEVRNPTGFRGKVVSLSFLARKGSTTPNASNLVVEVWQNTGASSQRLRNFSGGTLLQTLTIAGSTLTTSFVKYSMLVTTPVSSSATTLALVIGYQQAGTGPGDANDYAEVTDVILTTSGSGTVGRNPTFRQMDVFEELHLLESFYQQSARVGWNPVTGGLGGSGIPADFIFSVSALGSNGQAVNFRRRLRSLAPVVQVWTTSALNTPANVFGRGGGADKTVAAVLVDGGERFFITLNVNPASSDVYEFHWTADAETI